MHIVIAPKTSELFIFVKTSAAISKQNSLGKTERLKSRKLIEAIFSRGKSFVVAPFRVQYLFEGLNPELQAGFGVSTRNFPRAVDRNRVKRMTRENYRVRKSQLKALVKQNKQPFSVFFVYTAKSLPDHDTVAQKMEIMLEKLIKLVNENHPAHS